MEALLLFSHGSVLCGSEQNLLELAAGMRERGDAPIVEVGFLNYSEPRFADAVARCVEAGATRIVILPWFLIEGKFVVEDLPKAIASVVREHPSVEIRTAGVIGAHPRLVDAVLASAEAARPPESWQERMQEAKARCRESPRCPLYGSHFCSIGAEAAS